MDLDIQADENGFGGQIERPLSLRDLEEIRNDHELSGLIIGFRYVLCLVPRELSSDTFLATNLESPQCFFTEIESFVW